MFLKLNHQELDVYAYSKAFALECYRFTKNLPGEERFNMISQVRRAALSVHLNVAEGSSRKSETERKRFYEIARGSLIEVDAAFDIATELHYFENYNADKLGESTIKCFKILSGLINSRHTH